MRGEIIRARDGLELVSYLTLPAGDADRRPPERRCRWCCSSTAARGRATTRASTRTHQWLANRGYAVLSVNFRGSTGFGKTFVNAGNLRVGRQDARRPARRGRLGGEAGHRRPRRRSRSWAAATAATPRSSGLTFTPEVFACGVDIVGPSQPRDAAGDHPAVLGAAWSSSSTSASAIPTHRRRAASCSRSARRCTSPTRSARPLLIGQGANDPRVKQAESDQIVAAMQAKDMPVTYVLYPDEGHGFAEPANRISFNAVAEAFLAEHLGGRSEPFGQDFAGAKLEVGEGVQHVAGLEAALAARAWRPARSGDRPAGRRHSEGANWRKLRPLPLDRHHSVAAYATPLC